MVFPSNFLPDLDFTVIDSLDQLEEVIRRDFEAKAPSGTEILRRIEAGDHYRNRFELMRDVALNLFWTNRFAMTMYDKRPTRWRDVPRSRDDVFLPVLAPWQDAQRKVDAVQTGFAALPAAWDAQVEDEIFRVLFDVLRHRRFHATELPALKPTVAQLLAEPDRLTYSLAAYDPDYPVYGYQQILDCAEDVPELEALHRWAMVLHDQYPWDRTQTRLTPVGELRDDDYVVVFHPRNREVLDFIRRMRRDEAGPPRAADSADARPVTAKPPIRPYPAGAGAGAVLRAAAIEALAVVKGERLCTNEDLIRNTAYSWSPMSAEEITEKTGIESRVYTARPLEDIALQAARTALRTRAAAPEEIGAVLFCTCTSTPADAVGGDLAVRSAGHAADALPPATSSRPAPGCPTGWPRPPGCCRRWTARSCWSSGRSSPTRSATVRPARMIFGDGAAALVLAPAAPGSRPTSRSCRPTQAARSARSTRSSGPTPSSTTTSPSTDRRSRSLAGRYLMQMIDELKTQSDPDGEAATLLDSIDLIVPHQANKTMVIKLAEDAGLTPDQLYFNIETVGNTSAASIPLAIADAKADGVLTEPVRVFAPGYGAGAVGGYAVLRIDPAVIADERVDPELSSGHAGPAATRASAHTGPLPNR